MRKTTKKAFTLVELIVVITILTVLGTIGFMNYKGFTKKARNSTVIEELSTLARSIDTNRMNTSSVMGFIKKDTTTQLTSANYAGTGTTDDNYKAGTLNYMALSIKGSEFKSANGEEYKIGATKTAGGRFELAGVVNINDDKQAVIKGAYVARDANNKNFTQVTGKKTIVLSEDDINFFKTNDYVSIADSVTPVKIKRVDDDGVTLHFENDQTGNTIKLANEETAGLIKATDDQAVVDQGTHLPY